MKRTSLKRPTYGMCVAIWLTLTCSVLFSQETQKVAWQDIQDEKDYGRAAALYGEGRYAQAATLYKKACDHANPKACTDLGFMYRRGMGIKRNYPSAAELYRRGCDGGSFLGCTNLGLLYWNDTLPKNNERALYFFGRGCDGGESRACINLAYVYEKGLGIPSDKARAGELYGRACEQRNVEGCIRASALSKSVEAAAALSER